MSDAKQVSSESGGSTLYMPQMRAVMDNGSRNGVEVIFGRVIGPTWTDIPYEVVVGPSGGYMVGGVGIPLSSWMDRRELQHGLPFAAAESIRWAAIATAEANRSSYGIETRFVIRKTEYTRKVTESECIAYNCVHWDEIRRHGEASPAGNAIPVKERNGSSGQRAHSQPAVLKEDLSPVREAS